MKTANPSNLFLRVICILTLGILGVSSCFAGGSIGWDEVKAKISKDDPFLINLIERQYDVSRVGGALRVGRDAAGNSTVEGLEIGTRLPPYDFNAKPKGMQGDWTLHIQLEPSGVKEGQGILWTLTIRKKRDCD